LYITEHGPSTRDGTFKERKFSTPRSSFKVRDVEHFPWICMHHSILTLCIFEKKKYLTQIIVTIYRTVDSCQLVNKHNHTLLMHRDGRLQGVVYRNELYYKKLKTHITINYIIYMYTIIYNKYYCYNATDLNSKYKRNSTHTQYHQTIDRILDKNTSDLSQHWIL